MRTSSYVNILLLLLLSLPAMAQININAPGFNVLSNAPIDTRAVKANLSDTTSITWTYEGLLMYAQDVDQLWKYNGSYWEPFQAGSGINDISFSGDTLYVQVPDSTYSFYFGSYLDNTDTQDLSFSNDTLYLVDGGWVYLGWYTDVEVNDLTSAVTWDTIPDLYVQQSSVTQHQAALSITESQISDLAHTPNQTIDTLSYDNTTGILSASLSGDGVPASTVDLDRYYTPGKIPYSDGSGFLTTGNVNYNTTPSYTNGLLDIVNTSVWTAGLSFDFDGDTTANNGVTILPKSGYGQEVNFFNIGTSGGTTNIISNVMNGDPGLGGSFSDYAHLGFFVVRRTGNEVDGIANDATRYVTGKPAYIFNNGNNLAPQVLGVGVGDSPLSGGHNIAIYRRDSTVDNSASFPPYNFLYTNYGGVVMSAPGTKFPITNPLGGTNQLQAAIDSLYANLGGGGGAAQLSDLTDVNTSTPTNRNVLVADGVDWESRALDAADIQTGLFADARISESSVTQHEAALTITESQISDLAHTPNQTIDTLSYTQSTGTLLASLLNDAVPASSINIPNIGNSDLTTTGNRILTIGSNTFTIDNNDSNLTIGDVTGADKSYILFDNLSGRRVTTVVNDANSYALFRAASSYGQASMLAGDAIGNVESNVTVSEQEINLETFNYLTNEGNYLEIESGIVRIVDNHEEDVANNHEVLAVRRGNAGTPVVGMSHSLVFDHGRGAFPIHLTGIKSTWTDVTTNFYEGDLIFQTTRDYVMEDKVRIANDTVALLDYGSGTNTGTVAYLLAVDAEGNIVETTTAGNSTFFTDETLSSYISPDTLIFTGSTMSGSYGLTFEVTNGDTILGKFYPQGLQSSTQADHANDELIFIDVSPTPDEARRIDILDLLGGSVTTVTPSNASTQNIDFLSTKIGFKKQIIMSSITSAVTLTFSNPVNGGEYLLHFRTVTGTDAVTFPSNVYWMDGTAVGTLNITQATKYVLYYDGTNYYME